MRKLLLIGLGIWLAGCVVETPASTEVAGTELTDDSGDEAALDDLSVPNDRRAFVGNTAQALTLEYEHVDCRPPPQPWLPPAPPIPGDGPAPEPKR